jgi:hypothetical protein
MKRNIQPITRCGEGDIAPRVTPWPGPSAGSLDLDRNMAGCIEIATKAMLALVLLD